MVSTVNARICLAEKIGKSYDLSYNKDLKEELSFLEDISGIVRSYNSDTHEITIDLSKMEDFSITKCKPNTAGDDIILTIKMG